MTRLISCPVRFFVVEGEGEVLHMGKEIRRISASSARPADAPVGDDKVEHALEDISPHQTAITQRRSQKLEGSSRSMESLDTWGRARSTSAIHSAHIMSKKEFAVGTVIGDENAQIAASFHFFGGQGPRLLSDFHYFAQHSIPVFGCFLSTSVDSQNLYKTLTCPLFFGHMGLQ